MVMVTGSPQLSPSPRFFRSGAAAAAIAVAGIVLAQIVLIPAAHGPGLDALIRSYADPVFQGQSLTILVQVMAMFVALLALAVKVFPLAPGLTVLAAAALVMWQVLEILPRSIDYFVLSLDYAPGYIAGATDPAIFRSEFERFLAWERGWRTMRQVVWAAGLLLVGFAALKAPALGRLVGALFVVNGVRVSLLFLTSVAGLALPLGRWLFIVVNVACFGMLALWLWWNPELEHTRACRDASSGPLTG